MLEKLYKIYIEEKPLYLAQAHQVDKLKANHRNVLVNHFWGKPKFFLSIFQQLEKSDTYDAVILVHEDPTIVLQELYTVASPVIAGGGLVQNSKGEILFIYRRGAWDLPKGKQDEGETIEDTAIREVKEETGIENLTLGAYLTTTYHLYRSSQKKWLLKVSFWFAMKSSDTILIPQIEEDIEEIGWYTKNLILSGKRPIFNNIVDLLEMI